MSAPGREALELALVVLAVAGAAAFGLLRLRARLRAAPGAACGAGCGACPSDARGCAPFSPPRGRGTPALALALVLGAAASPARAASTLDVWAAGATDVEATAGWLGLGQAPANQSVFGDFQLGYGVAERLSAYAGLTLVANGFLAQPAPCMRLGVFTTVLDTGPFDLDLALEVGGSGAGLHLLPATELNLDLDTPVGRVGLYVRGALRLAGRALERGEGFETTAHLELTPGVSWHPREGRRVLVEAVGLLHFASAEAPQRWESCGLALGYNHVLSERLELVTQVSLSPGDDGLVALGLLVGFVATVP